MGVQLKRHRHMNVALFFFFGFLFGSLFGAIGWYGNAELCFLNASLRS